MYNRQYGRAIDITWSWVSTASRCEGMGLVGLSRVSLSGVLILFCSIADQLCRACGFIMVSDDYAEARLFKCSTDNAETAISTRGRFIV